MQPAVLVRLRPSGPWRYGSGVDGADRLDTLFRSDRLYSALTLAMRQLGLLSEWLAETAEAASPAVSFSSLFPYQGDALFVLPPATLWPPPSHLVTTPSPVFLSKLRWSAAQFVPVSLVETLLSGQKLLADQWIPDTESGCLLRRDRPSSSPFRLTSRTHAAVDRLTKSSGTPQSSACVEFEPGSGLWTLIRFRDETAAATWRDRVQAAFRLLGDTGFGARRSSGWGQSESPEFTPGTWPAILMPKLARALARGTVRAEDEGERTRSYWMLSLFSPAANDEVDWKNGSYQLEVRGGYVEPSSSASRSLKQQVRMIAEGSVLSSSEEPVGRAVDVAPEGFPHPVYRAGFALAFALPAPSLSIEDEGPETSAAESEIVEPQEESAPAASCTDERTADELPTVPEQPSGTPEEETPVSSTAAQVEEPAISEVAYAEPSFEDGGELDLADSAGSIATPAADDFDQTAGTPSEDGIASNEEPPAPAEATRPENPSESKNEEPGHEV